jgi:hypothetical protein
VPRRHHPSRTEQADRGAVANFALDSETPYKEFIRFLDVIDARTPAKRAVRVIIDNYAEKVMGWLAHHPRFVFHFTPTSASWLNAVEGVFALLSKWRLKRGAFRSIQERKDAIHDFIAANEGTER